MEKIRESLFIKQFCNEATRPEMIRLVRKYGGDGYMVYRLLLAYLWDNGLYIVPENISFISSGSLLMKDEDKAVEIVNYCLEIHLLETSTDDETKGMIFSQELMENKEVMDSKHEDAVKNGRKGGKESVRRRKAKETQAPLKPPSSPPQANKKERKTKRKKENETQKETKDKEQELAAANAAALSGSSSDSSSKGKYIDFPQDIKDICALICNKFNKPYAPNVYCQRIEGLIQEMVSRNISRGLAISRYIPETLKKLDTAQAITTGMMKFTIDSFLNWEYFAKLHDGAYDDVR